jgi:iron complex transport system substrate-binding protein
VILAQTISAATLWDYGIEVAGVYGDYLLDDGVTPDPQLGNVPADQVVSLGEWGEDFDIEGAIALGAELFVDVDRGGGMWSIDPEIETLINEFASTVAISTNQSARIATERFQALAVSLGADADSPAIADARLALEDAERALTAAAADKPGLKVLVMTGDPTSNAYFVNPETAGDLSYYASLGVEIVTPTNPDPEQLNVYETASWEAIGKYPADLILFDSRYDISQLETDTLWNSLPAVKAGQVGVWDGVFPNSWQGLRGAVDRLTASIQQSEIVT